MIIPTNKRLYSHFRARAEKATKDATEGRCVNKWYLAADLWEKTMPHSGYTPFQVKLEESMFVGEFQTWLKRHPAEAKRHKQCLADRKA